MKPKPELTDADNNLPDSSLVGAGVTSMDAAIAEILSTAEPATGLAAAMVYLRAAFDPDASVLWEAKPPKGSHITDIAQVLVEIEYVPRRIMVHAFSSGAFKVYTEATAKTPEGVIAYLEDHYQ